MERFLHVHTSLRPTGLLRVDTCRSSGIGRRSFYNCYLINIKVASDLAAVTSFVHRVTVCS